MITVARIALVVSGLTFLGLGVAFVVRPAPMAERIGLPPASPAGVTELRAMDGGLELGIGLVLLWVAASGAGTVPGLVLLLAAFGGLALGRAAGQ